MRSPAVPQRSRWMSCFHNRNSRDWKNHQWLFTFIIFLIIIRWPSGNDEVTNATNWVIAPIKPNDETSAEEYSHACNDIVQHLCAVKSRYDPFLHIYYATSLLLNTNLHIQHSFPPEINLHDQQHQSSSSVTHARSEWVALRCITQ